MSGGRSVWVEMFSGRSVGGRSVQAPAALRRDREQFIYNWMLEDDLDLD